MKRRGIGPFLPNLVLALAVISCDGGKGPGPEHEGGRKILPASEVHEGWYFGAGRTVMIEGTVNGDVYAAGGLVDVSGVVNGDLIVAGGEVSVSGTVTDDIRATGGNIRIGGKVGKNVTVAGGTVTIIRGAKIEGGLLAGCGNLQISGEVTKDVQAGAGSAVVSGTIGRNLNIEAEELTVLQGASIGGNVKARLADKERMSIADGTVRGKIDFENSEAKHASRILWYTPGMFWFKVLWAVWLLVLGLAFFMIFRKTFIAYATTVRRRTVVSALWGLAGLLLLPFVMAVLTVTIAGIPLMFLLFDIYLWLALLSQLSLALLLGDLIFRNIQETGWAPFWAFLVGLLILQALSFIPYLCALIAIVNLVLGFGALVVLLGEAWRARRAA
jgi:hypothetical protein